ncbi:MAG: CRISPR-associated endonuclease/helicase Cas3 [Bacteroidales bacterium]|jgi:CRISPR-associated endonuclease/helicase Cas3|nr:CRISPR-associated endonuclease/helicase Cas3 [Bacteroidales bacterium]
MQNFDIHFFKKLIPLVDDYFAHLPKPEQCGRNPELLTEHSALVAVYAQKIVDVHHLNEIIKKLIESSIPDNLNNRQLLSETIENLFWQAIAFHDFGKLNHGYQRTRMRNDANLLKVKHPFQNQHSVISVYLFLALFFADFLKMRLSDEEQIFICNVALYLSYPIYKHHSSTIEQAQDENNWCNADLFTLSPYLSLFDISLTNDQVENFHSYFLGNANFRFLFQHFNESIFKEENAFPLYALIKLNYSLLTAADYLATAHYMNDWNSLLTDFRILNNSLKEKIIINAQTSKSYNRSVYEVITEGKNLNPNNYTEQSNENLNVLRCCIATEVVANVKKNAEKNLFYIEAPTGSGKTNVSMLAVAELLKTDESLQKIFYVFPFTTLITQTYQSLKDTLGLDDAEFVEVHSKAAISTGNYEDDYLNYLDNLFLNYPITLLSHVRFFDIIKTNEKETNYLLHRLANSVVIIDEIQSYSPKTWDKIIYFIVNYAKYFNMKFIIMSATLPKIGDLIDRKKLANDFVYLISDKKKYFQNPNFCNRVKFDYSLLEREKPNKNDIKSYLEWLCETVFNKSEKYAIDNSVYPNSVFSIVEFIFKKTASAFYSIANKNNIFFDEIFLLSGTILEPRRKQIIDKLKAEETRGKKILLITTQVVEAGVDIDMDLGFKDKSIIDSEEQLAGRINRNVNKSECTLFLFDCDEEKTLYKGDDRYQIMHELDSEYKTILENKDFDRLYQLVIENIMRINNTHYIVNIQDLYDSMATLDFRCVNNSLKIINKENVLVFVPLDIDICLISSSIMAIDQLHIPYSTTLSGSDVWDKYVTIIQDQNEDFIKNKIQMKKIQSIMSLFSFSIFPNSREYESIKTYGCEKYGFLYLESFRDIYSFENGINTEKFSESNFL